MSEVSLFTDVLSRAVLAVPDRWFCRSTALVHLRFERELWPTVHAVDPDGIALDVGAWFGPWSYWLSRRMEVVHAFEANPKVAAVLARGARPNVSVHCVAISDHEGTVEMAIAGHGGGQEGKSAIVAEGSAVSGERVKVSCRTLDSFDFERVRFLKVDVEGHEFPVLCGAAGLLDRWHPVVFAELEDRYGDVSTAVDFMTELGYEARVLVEGRWR